MGVPTPRDAVGLGKSVEERLQLLEARIPSVPDRLAQTGMRIEDWDDAVYVGFYWSPDGYFGRVYVSEEPVAGYISQERQLQGYAGRWRREFNGTVWSAWRRESVTLRGTASERAATESGYWDFWQDTDGTQLLYVGNKSGGWRRFAGQVVGANRAWDGSTSPVWARSDTFDLGTVLETNENVLIQSTGVGSGYGFVSLSSTTRGPSDTQIQLRYMQVLAATTQSYSVAWQIAQVAG